MPASIEIRGLKEVRAFLEDLPDRLFEETKEIFKERTFSAHNRVILNLKFGSLRNRTGLLSKSIRPIVSGNTLDKLRAGIYSAKYQGGKEITYAPIHEYGGTITAKRAYRNVPGGPYLNIPSDENKTKAGVMRFTPKEVFQNMGGYIAGRGVFVPVNVSGSGNNADESLGVLMFSLVKSVKIKPRLGMHTSMQHEIPTLLSQLRSLDL